MPPLSCENTKQCFVLEILYHRLTPSPCIILCSLPGASFESLGIAGLHPQVPVNLHDNLQRKFHEYYGPPYLSRSLRKQGYTNTPIRLVAAQTDLTRTRLRAVMNCNISRDSITLPASKAGNLVELILL